ncbi:AsnC family transcriptional regulator [Pacificibacter maritimus]|uniref:AsnC family transcriptional regulator n=1 Tax=Pacificibacter maritimus TaxID=762213 RepID=A0A3N4UG16_9RHOB|nr:Lrp/AsnC family transcriptional regulator [Pacificibacter maritimus]RPE67405.1 AsnC family transcriptional regulator [Pacificibacter maritimus]
MIDEFEKRILKMLQQNGRASTQELSNAVGLSSSPCWRRVKRLEDDGFITRYAAILDGKKLGLHAFAHVQISLIDHSEASLNTFHNFVENSEQVLECASITGDFDFMLKIAAANPEALEHFIMQKILRLGVVRTMTTNFILRQIKVAGALPIEI